MALMTSDFFLGKNNLRTGYSTQPDFNSSDKTGKLKDHILNAFLKDFRIDVKEPPSQIQISNALVYDCFYERMIWEEGISSLHVIASFQMWKDGTKVAIIRPYKSKILSRRI